MKGLGAVLDEYADCQACGLSETRRNLVFGSGPQDSPIMFIGEGPGENEDIAGRPFVGRAGDLMRKLLKNAGVPREYVFLTNTVCCRPTTEGGKNRQPTTDEMAACLPRLIQTIYTIDPVLIVAAGKVPLQLLTKVTTPITKVRGKIYSASIYGKISNEIKYPVLATLHPAFLLRNMDPGKKGWMQRTKEDYMKAREIIELIKGGLDGLRSPNEEIQRSEGEPV
jgi:DNA polymerase